MRTVRGITRRALLKRAVVAAPYFVTASALGRTGRAAPSDRITLGHIGCGAKGGFRNVYWGSLLLECAGNPACQCLAVCDVDAERRDRSKAFIDEQYGNKDCAAYTDFRELVARDDIDAVIVATPEHWHAVQTVWACRHGKDVYCEKPLALTVRQARAMVAAARKYGRIVQTGSQSRSIARIRFGCEAVRDGRIGKVTEVHAGCGGPSWPHSLPPQPVPDHVDWDLYLGPAPWRPYNGRIHPGRGWVGMRDFGGGGMTDWGAHHFDIAQWGLGMDDSGPVEVFPPGHDGARSVSFRYVNGAMLYHGGGGVTFVGSEGRVSIHGLSATSAFSPPSLAAELRAEMEAAVTNNTGNKNNLDNFLDCVRSRRRPNADVEIGCRSVTVCHLGNIAYWLKRPLKWDPLKEQFVDDKEANRWLWRPMREPWRV